MAVKTWIKEHKKGLIIAGAIVVGGLIGYSCYKTYSNRRNDQFTTLNIPDYSSKALPYENLPKFDNGELIDLWREESGIMGIVNEVPMKSIGNLQDDFEKIDPNFSKINMIFTVE